MFLFFQATYENLSKFTTHLDIHFESGTISGCNYPAETQLFEEEDAVEEEEDEGWKLWVEVFFETETRSGNTKQNPWRQVDL